MNNPKYTLEDEKIIEYDKLSLEQKLKWLEDALLFNTEFFSGKEKSARDRLKEQV